MGTAAATTVATTTVAATTAAASNGTTATVFTGNFALTMSSADATAMIAAFETDTAVRTALQNGIATGLSIDSSMVVVTGVSAQGSRRLAAGDSSVVQVDCTITVPAGSSTTLTASDITGTGAQTALKDSINSAMTAQSLSYVVNELSAPTPTVTTVTLTTTTTTAAATTSIAYKVPASYVSIVAGLGAVALLVH